MALHWRNVASSPKVRFTCFGKIGLVSPTYTCCLLSKHMSMIENMTAGFQNLRSGQVGRQVSLPTESQSIRAHKFSICVLC